MGENSLVVDVHVPHPKGGWGRATTGLEVVSFRAVPLLPRQHPTAAAWCEAATSPGSLFFSPHGTPTLALYARDRPVWHTPGTIYCLCT